MKKIATLLLILLSLAGISTSAQNTACNAAFNFTYLNGNTIQFNPAMPGIPASTQHYWLFGDGAVSNTISPVHTYTSGSVFIVKHIIIAFNPNGVEVCRDSAFMTITVQNACNLVVNFTATAISASGNAIHFENNSTPLNPTDSITWNFGDGSSSHEISPNHTYTQPGTYNVCLRIKQNTVPGTVPCVREICRTIIVQSTTTCILTASFTWSPVAGTVNTLHFQNTSAPLSNTDSIRWTFGDGTTSSQVSPNHTYAQSGTYTVCLRIQKRGLNGGLTNCIREICNTIVIQTPAACNLVANFYAYRDSLATVPNSYHFVNTSMPLNNTDSIRWTFGDGTSSNQVNPNHIYTQPGTYTVCLRIQKRELNGGLTNCIREICHPVTVMPVCNIQSNFSWRADSLNNRRIYFINQSVTSTAGATATWSFGDGTSSTAWNPIHEYAQPGRYYVCLKVQVSPTCFSYSCDSVTVQASLPNCTQQSNFSFTRATNNSQLFHFTPAYTNSNWQYTWTFGDGTGSHDINPSHQYAQPGNYTVCLTVYRNANCASTTCRTIYVQTQVNCNNINVTYNYQRDPVITNKLYFQAVSNYTLVSQTWTITKLPATGTATVTLLQNNPSYVFQDTGYYRVCLRAVTLGGCVKEYCREIYIRQVVTPANCSLQVYPNPVTSQVNLNIYLTQPQMIDVYIYNAQNVQVKEKHQQGFAGTNIISIPVNDLVAGTYTMRVIRGNSVCYAQFVKL